MKKQELKAIEQSELTPEQEIIKALNESINRSGWFEIKLMCSVIQALRENESGTCIEGNYTRVVKSDYYSKVVNTVVNKLKES